MTDLNQKEYLKRYLSKSKGKKKKKKVPKGIVKDRIKVIDDNIDVQEQVQTIQDIENENEDAPQIVAIIDDRPIELRLNKFKDQSNWTTFDMKPVIKDELCSPEHNGESSPCTQERHNSDDESPPRRNAYPPKSDDESPPRRRRKHDSDESPPRRERRENESPPRKRNSNDDDTSPPRRRNRKHDSDESPPRRHKSPHRSSPKSRKVEKSYTERKRKLNQSRWTSRTPSPARSAPAKATKATKTLDGKTAGLQNAKELARETEELRKREAQQIAQMSADVSGVNAATVLRDRRTGHIRDLEAEAIEKATQKEKANELQQKYDRWGKGVKQAEDYKQKLEAAAHEMSKPLARYADDEDLDRYLKEQEREGDPMLQYIKKKKKTEAVKTGVKLKPEYMGEFMPNRFGIRPGHRWDGVDRSNGYEKKWFDAINKRNADREEAYKWNSEDM